MTRVLTRRAACAAGAPLRSPARRAALAAAAALALLAPPAFADVVFDKPRAAEVWAVADDGEPRLLARGGSQPAASADGSVVAYVRRADDGVVLLRPGEPAAPVVTRSGGRARPLRDVSELVLSPDGTRLAVQRFLSGWIVVDLASGATRALAVDELSAPRFSADGRTVVWLDTSTFSIMAQAADRRARPRRLFRGASDATWVGGRVAVLYGSRSYRRQRVMLVDPFSGVREPLRIGPAPAVDLGPVHSNALLTLIDIGESRDVVAVRLFDFGGPLVRTIRARRGAVLEDAMAFSDDGRVLYVVESRALVAVDVATGARRVVARDVFSVV